MDCSGKRSMTNPKKEPIEAPRKNRIIVFIPIYSQMGEENVKFF
ncbi:hypothetical protein SSUR61_1971 [Streptococcus suis R61]|uniref:Uncharacterized protein n=1 Tax=Streptococcus suis R61 TaxID=996306 RepID=A0AA87F845_STRSU|nr:hypothetical protein SSUR61_1971 [Streptococcus suis R61]